MQLVGERWALLIVRELMFGPRRFVDLRRGVPGISANVFSQRLGELAAPGNLARQPLPLMSRLRSAMPASRRSGRWVAGR